MEREHEVTSSFQVGEAEIVLRALAKLGSGGKTSLFETPA
jgi:hypothetical protein